MQELQISMQLKEYILNNIAVARLDSTIDTLKKTTHIQGFSHLPIVENEKLVGTIAEGDLSTLEEGNRNLSEFRYVYSYFFATEEDNLVDLITLFAIHETNVLPVLDKDKKYIGYYDLNDILNIYAETPYLKEEGVVLLIEKELNSYSMSEIAQITETSNGKLLGCMLSQETDNTAQITVKIKTENIDEIIQSFRRYGYQVLSNHEDDSYLEELKNRSNYLQKYLSI